MRKSKIVCTIGPACEDVETLRKMVKNGMNIARLNLSHGDYETHLKVLNNIREASKIQEKPVGILVDLQGPKIRLGNFEKDIKYFLHRGDIFTITTKDIVGTQEICSTTYKGLPGDCHKGDQLLIDDGKVRVEVTEVTKTDVTTTVKVGGPISNHKGINLPNANVALPALTEKDEENLRWALDKGVDMIALSFVRNAKDYDDVKKIMDETGTVLPVIAKVEKPQAVENLVEVVKTFDTIMVARGDLGVEIPYEQLPLIQREMVKICRRYSKPIIVATQMLESMVTSPVPTRAEVSDIANAVFNGADATMTSAETSVAADPVLTVKTMAKIALYQSDNGFDRIHDVSIAPSDESVTAESVINQANTNDVIAVWDNHTTLARTISSFRPKTPILLLTSNTQTYNSMALCWGVYPYLVDEKTLKERPRWFIDEALKNLTITYNKVVIA
jgi:pyruvate kinase